MDLSPVKSTGSERRIIVATKTPKTKTAAVPNWAFVLAFGAVIALAYGVPGLTR